MLEARWQHLILDTTVRAFKRTNNVYKAKAHRAFSTHPLVTYDEQDITARKIQPQFINVIKPAIPYWHSNEKQTPGVIVREQKCIYIYIYIYIV
jgi:hypothetical protein